MADLFEGVFDDPVTGMRIKYRDGRPVAVVSRLACGSAPLAVVLGMAGTFGTNPPPPPWLPPPATPFQSARGNR